MDIVIDGMATKARFQEGEGEGEGGGGGRRRSLTPNLVTRKHGIHTEVPLGVESRGKSPLSQMILTLLPLLLQ